MAPVDLAPARRTSPDNRRTPADSRRTPADRHPPPSLVQPARLASGRSHSWRRGRYWRTRPPPPHPGSVPAVAAMASFPGRKTPFAAPPAADDRSPELAPPVYVAETPVRPPSCCRVQVPDSGQVPVRLVAPAGPARHGRQPGHTLARPSQAVCGAACPLQGQPAPAAPPALAPSVAGAARRRAGHAAPVPHLAHPLGQVPLGPRLAGRPGAAPRPARAAAHPACPAGPLVADAARARSRVHPAAPP
jgi:hypothetical protein